jgi:acyl-CoA reductase-like NAD-dependent aldehyde dehydrogenase
VRGEDLETDVNPWNSDTLLEIVSANHDDVDDALDATRVAQRERAALRPACRAEVLHAPLTSSRRALTRSSDG